MLVNPAAPTHHCHQQQQPCSATAAPRQPRTHRRASALARGAVRCSASGEAPEQCAAAECPSFSFWHDEKAFKGTGDTSVAQRTLLAMGGTRVGGNAKADPTLGSKGWQVPHQWDVLWSPSSLGHRAAQEPLSAHQVINAVPGSRVLTRKKLLPRTLRAAYGPGAFRITPTTFEVPSELRAFIDYLKQHKQQGQAPEVTAAASLAAARQEAAASSSSKSSNSSKGTGRASLEDQQQLQQQQQQARTPGLLRGREPAGTASREGSVASAAAGGADGACGPDTLWVLKTSEHLGKGIRIVKQRDVLVEVLDRFKRHTEVENKKEVKPFLAVQRYCSQPLLVNGRKFGLRVWAAVTSSDPLRVYLHSTGLVLFSSQLYRTDVDIEDQQSHLTNYAQNVDGDVWSLDMLRQHMGGHAYDTMMGHLRERTAAAFAAAAPALRAKGCGTRATAYELFGLDFLVEENLEPWLLEVNATPSLAVEHQNISVERMIHATKAGMVRDLFSLVRIPARFAGAPTAAPAAGAPQLGVGHPLSPQEEAMLAATQAELCSRAGFAPLMHLFPTSAEAATLGGALQWSPRDDLLRQWCIKQAGLQPEQGSVGAGGRGGSTLLTGPLQPAAGAVPHKPSHLHAGGRGADARAGAAA